MLDLIAPEKPDDPESREFPDLHDPELSALTASGTQYFVTQIRLASPPSGVFPVDFIDLSTEYCGARLPV